MQGVTPVQQVEGSNKIPLHREGLTVYFPDTRSTLR
jgi:hypothetical protein